MKTFLLTLFSCLCLSSFAQNGVSFHVNQFDKALELAKKEGKDIFLDSYAPWCVPCKKMDKVFKDPKLANYYNQNFINVKVNVDEIRGKEIATKYDIVFLPTMFIMDHNGHVKHRIDGLQSSENLLQIGDFAVNPQNYKIEKKEPIVEEHNTIVEAGIEVEDIQEEKILFVLDDPNVQNNPDYLYHESFFRLKQMDGSHREIAERYIKTQDDLFTERNLDFIINFLERADSKMFDFYASNSEDFINIIGEKEYRMTLEILINANLYNQIPRPDFQRVNYLYSLLYPEKASKYSYLYMLQRLEDEENYKEYVDLGESYLNTLESQDPKLLYKLGKYKCEYAQDSNLKECIHRVEESISLTEENEAEQLLTLAQLYLKAGKKKKAIEAADQAKSLNSNNNSLKVEINEFLMAVQEL